MYIHFLIQEDGEASKVLEYEGEYTVKDLEKVYTELIDTTSEWFNFKTPPSGFVTRKKFIKTVYLREQPIT